jgi:hypothetical protein
MNIIVMTKNMSNEFVLGSFLLLKKHNNDKDSELNLITGNLGNLNRYKNTPRTDKLNSSAREKTEREKVI